MTQYRACPRCGKIHPYNQPCPMKKPVYRYERTGADRLRFTSRWKRKSLQVRDDAHWMCEVCRDQGKVTTEGLEVHHIEKLREDPDGLIEDDNLVCLCALPKAPCGAVRRWPCPCRAGGTGLVPAPATGAANRYLCSDGTWQVPPDNNITYPNMGDASSSAAGYAGLVPAPAAGASNRYLRSDGTWSVPPDNNTNTTYSLSKNSSTITFTGSDGSTTSVTDSNTTYSLSSFGVNASATELNYVKGVTSSIQTQLNGKAASNHTHSNYLTTAGTAAAATKLATARSISIAGDGSGSASFDGTSNISIDTTILHHWATAIPAKADLNSYTDPGWYMCNSYNDVATLSNRPGNIAFAMVVLNHAGIAQIVFEYMTSGYKIYTRNKYGNVWGSWGRVYTTENKPTYSEIGAAAASHSHSNYLTTSGTAAAASKLATARTISLAGDVTGSANFDGSANISITNNIAAGTVGTNELASNAVTNAKIAADLVSLAKLGSDVGTVAVQSSQPSDTNVKLWIQI